MAPCVGSSFTQTAWHGAWRSTSRCVASRASWRRLAVGAAAKAAQVLAGRGPTMMARMTTTRTVRRKRARRWRRSRRARTRTMPMRAMASPGALSAVVALVGGGRPGAVVADGAGMVAVAERASPAMGLPRRAGQRAFAARPCAKRSASARGSLRSSGGRRSGGSRPATPQGNRSTATKTIRSMLVATSGLVEVVGQTLRDWAARAVLTAWRRRGRTSTRSVMKPKSRSLTRQRRPLGRWARRLGKNAWRRSRWAEVITTST
mmetsp:Transcript_59793/g.135082  ORF Transcript_59793/g.135082 Transcript_59793/m.135082 type:complete len:262 (-) Transcript_59793:929-1714(-)